MFNYLKKLLFKDKEQIASFPDLCPTDDAKNVDVYVSRLNELLNNRKNVKEIAITAPYSGGKSSFLNTYMRLNTNHKYTCISLTSFKETIDDNEDKDKTFDKLNQIEKSIVQQILYKTDHSKNIHSRFRRSTPIIPNRFLSILKSTSFLLWIASFWAIIYIQKLSIITILSTEGLFLWIKITLVLYLLFYAIWLCVKIINFFSNVGISKLNISKGEVIFDSNKRDSTFNMYLEEILYYFQITNSDVVVFEDLDRFECTDIFIKLKELNKLINDSSEINQNVVFIYALKDDVFKGKNRTKFFDSIIPIIPIANISNSYPQLKDLIKKYKFENDFEDEFLRNLSIFIDDMRMLKNIVSEYGVYKEILMSKLDNIDLNKLFSFMVYKNLYCEDFANLQDNKGEFLSVIKNLPHEKEKLIKEKRVKIEEIKARLFSSQKDHLECIKELNIIYIIAVIQKIEEKEHHWTVRSINNLTLFTFINSDDFEELIDSEKTVQISFNNGQIRYECLNNWGESMNPPYKIRKENLNIKNKLFREGLESDINKIKYEIDSIQNLSIKEFCNFNIEHDLFKNIGDKKLLIHLISKGYLTEEYHLYISIFHEGNISKNDIDFLLSVKNREKENFDKVLENPKNVLEFLFDEDFRSITCFNYNLIDYLLINKKNVQLKLLINNVLISADDKFSLVIDSIEKLNSKDNWINLLLIEWDRFLIELVEDEKILLDNKNGLLLKVFNVLKDENYFLNHKEGFDSFSTYLGKLEFIFDDFLDDINLVKLFKIFDILTVKFQNLESYRDYHSFLFKVLEFQTFHFSLNNVLIIYNSISPKNTLDILDYSLINELKNELFILFFNENIDLFAKWVGNTDILVTNKADYINLLNNDKIIEETKSKIIETNSFYIEDINTVPDKLWNIILTCFRVKTTWQNLISLNEKISEVPYLTEYINKPNIFKALVNDTYDLPFEEEKVVLELLLKEEIGLEAFKCLTNKIKHMHDLSVFKSFSLEKTYHLLVNNLILDTIENYSLLRSTYPELSIILLENNFISIYNEDTIDQIQMSSNELYTLLENHKLNSKQIKFLVESQIEMITPNSDKQIITLIQNLCISKELKYQLTNNIPNIGYGKLTSILELIENEVDQILVLSYQIQYLNKDLVLKILSTLKEPYCKMMEATRLKYIKNSMHNRILIEALDCHSFIKKYKIIEKTNKIQVFVLG